MTQMMLIARYSNGDRRHVLPSMDCVVGSHDQCAIALSDPTVSRRHARLHHADDGWTLEDLGSSNGTRINGQRLDGSQRVEHGDELQFGSLSCALVASDQADADLAVLPQSLIDSETTQDRGNSGRRGNSGGNKNSRMRASAADSASSPGRSTVSSDRLTRWFTDAFPALVMRLAQNPASDPAVHATKALSEIFGGQWAISSNDAIRAASGKLESDGGSALSYSDDAWTVQWSSRRAVDQRTYERLARPALALVRMRRDASRSAAAPAPDSDAPPSPEPATQHTGLASLYEQATRVAGAGLNVLIEGQSGTGKELFARYLHRCGAAEQPLVTLNCASLAQDLLESELFGIEQGVATGVNARPGKFEQAHGGVLFLDEIGDMHSATQAKLLRVLQEQEVFRIGATHSRPARMQVVSATNRSLQELIASGDFRLDLYHRISDWRVPLPELSKRMVDLANLAAHFLRAACAEMGHRFGGISRAALEQMQAYAWPGNVRELEREMQRCALFLDDGEALRSDHLDARIRQTGGGTISGQSLKSQLQRTEKQAIELALQLCRGDVTAAAERLEIGKSTLYRQMKNLDIDSPA